jgi:alkylation response protein AidB-like acyl-CoA dehydrogenase
MDFKLNEQQLLIKNNVREFCKKEFKSKLATEFDRKEIFPLNIYKKAAKLGFTSIHFPKEYNGKGLGLFETCLVVEEMCRSDSSLGIAISSGNFGSDLILDYGTEEQKNKYLPSICCGDYISAAAFTEPHLSGSDPAHIETTAIKYGKDWWINGKKIFITNAPIADFIIILAQTDSKIRPSYKGETLFIIDKSAKGLEIKKMVDKMGIRPSLTGEINLKKIKASDHDILGDLNRGFYHSMSFFDKIRVGVAAQAVGIAQGAFEIALQYSKQREAFGKPILQHELIGGRLASMATKIEAARLLTYKSVSYIDKGKIDPMLTSMAKLYASEVAMAATDMAIQTLGGYGYLGEYRVERFHRDAKITEIYEGTSEIQKLTILKYLLRSF